MVVRSIVTSTKLRMYTPHFKQTSYIKLKLPTSCGLSSDFLNYQSYCGCQGYSQAQYLLVATHIAEGLLVPAPSI